MYLSELFLGQVKRKKSVLEALTICDRELKKRLHDRLESEDILEYYFEPERQESKLHIRELMEFWDVYRKYAGQVSRKEKEDNAIFILECVYEVDGIYHCDMCEKMIRNWSREQQIRLEKLCGAIEQIMHPEYICFFEGEKESCKERCRLELGEFLNRPHNFGYYAVRQKLMEYMDRGGLAIVAASQKKLIPRQLTGFRLRDRTYGSMHPEEAEGFRRKVLAAPPEEALLFYPKGDSDLIPGNLLL